MDNKLYADARIFQIMVEQTRDYALFVLDPQGNVATWNAGAERIKGYKTHEIVGRHFSTFYTHESVVAGWPQYELRMATVEGRFEDEGWRLRKDGSRFWAGVVITALRDEEGKLLGFSKITRDLTERKLHEEALRQSEERFRLLLEGVIDYAIYMVNTEGMVTSWNAGAERITGYARQEVVGHHFSRFYSPEAIEEGVPWNELSTARRAGRSESEGWRVRKSGERFWARIVISALYGVDHRLCGFSKVTQDLTERRHMQDLERATKNLTEFIAVLAHELRNPLAPIRSAVLALPKLAPDDPKREAMFHMIDRQSAHLTRIVDDMLDIAQISRGNMTIDLSPISVANVIEQSVEAARPLIEDSRHLLFIQPASPGAMVHGDLDRLIQLLTNLLNNAARYTPAGGAITIKQEVDASRIKLSVIDTGCGIAPGQIEQIFNMFVQNDRPKGGNRTGLGIGLALARKIAELHGGTLHALSEGEGRGAEFIVSLPLYLHDEAIVPPLAPRASPDREIRQLTRRVLVVDDNVDAAEMLHHLLLALGHQSSVVTDSSHAVEQALNFDPDVVLLDIAMPGLDGYEVARRLRVAKGARLRIVALSGFHEAAAPVPPQEAGFDLHLVKPIDLDGLAQALEV